MKTSSVFKSFENVSRVNVAKPNQSNQQKPRISMKTVQDGVNLSLSVVLLLLLLRRMSVEMSMLPRFEERIVRSFHRVA